MFRAVRAFLDQAPELRPWSLKFKDDWLERRFQVTYFDTNLQYIRVATFLGAVTWAAFGPLSQLVLEGDEVVPVGVERGPERDPGLRGRA